MSQDLFNPSLSYFLGESLFSRNHLSCPRFIIIRSFFAYISLRFLKPNRPLWESASLERFCVILIICFAFREAAWRFYLISQFEKLIWHFECYALLSKQNSHCQNISHLVCTPNHHRIVQNNNVHVHIWETRYPNKYFWPYLGIPIYSSLGLTSTAQWFW